MGTISIVRVTALCLAISGSASVFCKVAQVVGVEENKELAQLFNRSMTAAPSPSLDQATRLKARLMCAQDRIQSAPDMYRAATILAKSEDVKDLLLAQDLALASMVSGFRPGMKIVQIAQDALLEKFGVHKNSEPVANRASSENTGVTPSASAGVETEKA